MSTWVGQYEPIELFCLWTKVHRIFSSNVERVVVDPVFLRCSTCPSVPEIFAIKVKSCQKSRRNLDVFLVLWNFRGRAFQKLYSRYNPGLAARVCGHMLTGEMLTGQMLTGQLLTGQMLTPLSKIAHRTNAHKCVFVWFDFGTANLTRQNYGLLIFIYLFLGFLPPPSPALLTYGHPLCQTRRFGGFYVLWLLFCRPTSILLLTDKVN